MGKAQNMNKALTALLETDTLTAAAEKAGISRKTLYSYLTNDKEFASAYMDAQSQQRIERLDEMREAALQARNTIMEIMTDKGQPTAMRLKAAAIVLDEVKQAEKEAEKAVKASLYSWDDFMVSK